jgi:hypothetical protein
VGIEEVYADAVGLRLPWGEVARLSVATEPPTQMTLGGWSFRGPGLHVVRVGPDARWLAAESVREVPGAFRLAAPGPVEVRRLPDGDILVGTTEAIELDAAWAGDGDLRRLSVLEHDGWAPVGELERAGVVDVGLVAGLRARTGHAFLWLLLRRA